MPTIYTVTDPNANHYTNAGTDRDNRALAGLYSWPASMPQARPDPDACDS